MSAEWCQIDPKVLVHQKRGVPVESHITFFGMTIQDNIDAMKSPHAIITRAGDLEVRLEAPNFPWAFIITVKWGRKEYSTYSLGAQGNSLPAGKDFNITIHLPEV